MDPFVINSHGHLVFPSNFVPQLDFSVMRDVDHLTNVIQRDFETKSPTGTDSVNRVELDRYSTRFDLMRDIALNLFWANRYAMTMYDKRPTRLGDLPRQRDDVYLPVLTPWEGGEEKVLAIRKAYDQLPAAWNAEVEDDLFQIIFDVFSNRRHTGLELPAIKPTVGEALADPHNLTWRIGDYDRDYPSYSLTEILDCREEVAELEALRRWAMVLHNEYPWNRSKTDLVEVGTLTDDDFVVAFHPRDREVAEFLRRVKSGRRSAAAPANSKRETKRPIRPFPPLNVHSDFKIAPRLEALAIVKGEHLCTNDDLIRNSAYNWSPMSASEISKKTGIEQRLYTEDSLEIIALEAAEAALAHAGREPEEIGGVIFCTCTSTRLIPSLATWLSGELGIYQTQGSYDLIAACAGFPYGLFNATMLLQSVNRPVLLVCAEKFSDKIGTVRPSRMIFGDGASAVIIGPAPEGQRSDIDYLQAYASGPVSEVNSIIWPNPMFDNNITVYGPEVKSLAGRYLMQMIGELQELPAPEGETGSLLDHIDLVVPHQANKTMVIDLAKKAGLSADRLYFDIEKVGNVSAASIPIALHDAISEGVITAPIRAFCPGFGAGAVGGYSVMRVDPAIAAPLTTRAAHTAEWIPDLPSESPSKSSDDVALAFGGGA